MAANTILLMRTEKGRDVGEVLEGINQGGSGYRRKCGRKLLNN